MKRGSLRCALALLAMIDLAAMAHAQNTTAARTLSAGQVREQIINHKGQDLSKDTDGDGISDFLELQLGTDPNSADSDADGTPDGIEVAHGLDPSIPNPAPDLVYIVNRLDVPSGYKDGALGSDISNTGIVAGFAITHSTTSKDSAVRWNTKTGAVDVATNAVNSYGWVVNDNGAIAGKYNWLALYWAPGSAARSVNRSTDDTLYSSGINSSGKIVGYLNGQFPGDTGAFAWEDSGDATGNFTHLSAPSGYRYPRADSINDKGQIVGVASSISTYQMAGVIWNGATASIMFSATGTTEAAFDDVWSINRNGAVLGYKSYRPAVWTSTEGRKYLPTGGVGVSASALDINAFGEVLGTLEYKTTVWRPDGNGSWSIIDVNSRILDPVAMTSFRGEGMNDAGQITGSYRDAGKYIPVVLTPILRPSLAVDANRDGVIKLASEDASDATFVANPHRFWLNDDIDRGHTVDGDDYEQDDIGPDEAAKSSNNWKPDCEDDVINSERDLEDFTRLWISLKGLAAAINPPPTSPSSALFIGLKWTNVPEGAPQPAIRLFSRLADNGALDYLTDPVKGSAQSYAPRVVDARHYDPSQPAAPVSPEFSVVGGTGTFIIPSEKFYNLTETNSTIPFVFEACKPGKGQLKIVILKKDGENYMEIGDGPGVWMDLKKIGDMYEHWSVGNASGGEPDAVAARISSLTGSPTIFKYDAAGPSPEERKYILYVHGWNMERWEKERFAETAYKRLYWQGYKGRFGLFSWPTTNGFEGNLRDAAFDSNNYDRGEWAAWKSATPLRALLQTLHGPGAYADQVYVVAHSMGNVVTGEALRLASQQGSGQIVNTYAASQAALPVHVYDGGSTNLLDAIVPHTDNTSASTIDEFPETANVYPDWMAGNGLAVGTRVNFYNVNDFALWRDAWELNQHFKPDHPDAPSQPHEYVYLDDVLQAPTVNGFGWLRTDDTTDPTDRILWNGDHSRFWRVATLQLGNQSDVGNRYEIMAFAAESRSKALGGTPGNGRLERSVDLQTSAVWPADLENPLQPHASHKWHSAEFRSTNMRQKGYWKALLDERGFNLGTTP